MLTVSGQSSVGDVWLAPSSATVPLYTTFTTEVRVNSGTDRAGAIGINIGYNPGQVMLDTTQAAGGIDTTASGFLTVINDQVELNTLKLAGYRTDGAPRGEDVLIFTVFWKAVAIGTPGFDLTVRTLTAASSLPIEIRTVTGCSVDITSLTLGDVNGDGYVNIVDALKTAQYAVGEEPQGFIAAAADVNSDNKIDAIDALMIARYFVGALPAFPGHLPDPPGNPTPFPEPVGLTVKLLVEGSGTASVNIVPLDNRSGVYAVIKGTDGTEKTIYYNSPALLEILPGSSFIRWGGDWTGTDRIRRLLVDKPLYIEARFGAGPTSTRTAAPSATRTPTAVPVPTPYPTEIRDIGKVSFSQSWYTVAPGSSFITPVHVNSGYQKLAAYGFDILYDNEQITLDETIGTNGVLAGRDGFVSAVNAETPGLAVVSGFDVEGKGPGTELEVLTLQWTASSLKDSSELGITVNNLNDETGAVIGTPFTVSSIITIAQVASSGDANNDGIINIVDALMAAQYLVGLSPAGFDTATADVNGDGVINIIDALMIAQYAVGIINHF